MDSSQPPIQGPTRLDESTLDRALDDLRVAIRSRVRVPAERAESSLHDWMEAFDRARQWLGAFGIEERTGEVDEFGADEVAIRKAAPLLDALHDRYWRVDVHGLEHVPELEPCLLVANRAGLLPYDGIMISHVLARGRPCGLRPRFLVADWLVTLPFAQPSLARLGGVRASRENASRLLRHGHQVIAFPEGAKGATKLFRDRYRLQRFGRGGVVRLAREAQVPVVPVAVIGAEEVHPVFFRVETLARSLGLPFLPVTPTFPWLGPAGLLPLPSKWSIRFGPPLPIDRLGPDAADDELLLSRLTAELRERIQEMIDEGLSARPSVWG